MEVVLGLGLGLGLGLHEKPGGAARGGPAGLIEGLDTEASWGAAGSLWVCAVVTRKGVVLVSPVTVW